MDKISNEAKYPELQNISTAKIYGYLDILNDLQSNLKYTTSKRAYLELAIIKMMNHHSIELIELESEVKTLNSQIQKLESMIQNQKKVLVEPKVTQQTKIQNNLKPLVTVKQVEEILFANEQFTKYLDGKAPKKVIFVKGKIINVVI